MQNGTVQSRKGDTQLHYLQEVLVYLDPADGDCQNAIDFLQQHGIAFKTRDTAADPEARRELRWIGAERVPTIVVNGVAVEGFDHRTLCDVLGIDD